MASTIGEIESFTLKFKNLLAHGFKASLLFEAENYGASVTLKAGLSLMQVAPPLHISSPTRQDTNESHVHNRKPRTPSYYRRQERRKYERNEVLESHQCDSSEEKVDAVKHQAEVKVDIDAESNSAAVLKNNDIEFKNDPNTETKIETTEKAAERDFLDIVENDVENDSRDDTDITVDSDIAIDQGVKEVEESKNVLISQR